MTITRFESALLLIQDFDTLLCFVWNENYCIDSITIEIKAR